MPEPRPAPRLRLRVAGKCVSLRLLLLLLGWPANAQTPSPGTSTTPSDAAAADIVAIVDGEVVRAADLDANAREAAASLESDLSRARREALDEDIRDRILAIEARRRRSTPNRLYLVEILDRLPAPTAEQVSAEHDRRTELRGEPLEEVRDLIIGDLLDRLEQERYAAWAREREAAIGVQRRRDAAAPDLSSGDVLAIVGREKVTWGTLQERLAPKLYACRSRVARLKARAVSQVVTERLLASAARRQGVSPEELLARERDARIRHPTEAEIRGVFDRGGGQPSDFDAERSQIAAMLEEFAREDADAAFSEALRKSATIEMKEDLRMPPPPALPVATSGSPQKGGARASVTIVEFGDFECGPCAAAHPMVAEVLRIHGERVRLVFRQFPLNRHPHARRAAEAALAANAQGMFWPYADALFANQRSLDDASLRDRARRCGLDTKRFEDDLLRRRFGEQVVGDIRDGRRYGARWTPTFFIDGVLFEPSQDPDAFAKAVAARIARTQKQPPGSARP